MANKNLKSFQFPGFLQDIYTIPETVIDNTLTQSGQAADSKAVGDEFDNIREIINNNKIIIDTTLTQSGQTADAFETGSKITSLKEDLTQFQESGDVHIDPASFQVGGIDTNTGDIVPSYTRRAVMTNISIAAYDMTLTVDSAHKMVVAYYTNNVYEDVSSWKSNGSIAINKGQQYRLVIADYPTETESTSVEEKVSGLSCTSIFSNLLSCVASENETWE